MAVRQIPAIDQGLLRVVELDGRPDLMGVYRWCMVQLVVIIITVAVSGIGQGDTGGSVGSRLVVVVVPVLDVVLWLV